MFALRSIATVTALASIALGMSKVDLSSEVGRVDGSINITCWTGDIHSACYGHNNGCEPDNGWLLTCQEDHQMVYNSTCNGFCACDMATGESRCNYNDDKIKTPVNETCWTGAIGDPCHGHGSGCEADTGYLLTCSDNQMLWDDDCIDGNPPGTCHCLIKSGESICMDYDTKIEAPVVKNETCWTGAVGDPCYGHSNGCQSNSGFLLTCSGNQMLWDPSCSIHGDPPGACHCQSGDSSCQGW